MVHEDIGERVTPKKIYNIQYCCNQETFNLVYILYANLVVVLLTDIFPLVVDLGLVLVVI